MMTMRLTIEDTCTCKLVLISNFLLFFQDEHIMNNPCMLTQAELEEYSRLQYIHHQKQSSYAQSEGYHSYVSSTDSTSATPFLDRCVCRVVHIILFVLTCMLKNEKRKTKNRNRQTDTKAVKWRSAVHVRRATPQWCTQLTQFNEM